MVKLTKIKMIDFGYFEDIGIRKLVWIYLPPV